MASNPNTDKLTIGGGHYEGRAEMFFVDENGNKTQLETSYYSPGTDFVIPTDNDNPSSYVIATQDAS
ncbi:hypothetical protein FACS1894166_12420 [Bacilli bacterium]|nr:hypothetical protein FACS1894166_12420 [Bacilli bacterium]